MRPRSVCERVCLHLTRSPLLRGLSDKKKRSSQQLQSRGILAHNYLNRYDSFMLEEKKKRERNKYHLLQFSALIWSHPNKSVLGCIPAGFRCGVIRAAALQCDEPNGGVRFGFKAVSRLNLVQLLFRFFLKEVVVVVVVCEETVNTVVCKRKTHTQGRFCQWLYAKFNSTLSGARFYLSSAIKAIHPFTITADYPALGAAGVLEPIFGRRRGYTLDKSATHRRANTVGPT